MACTGTAGTAGREICDLLDGVGNGLGVFLDALDGPFAVFLILLAVVGGAVAIFFAIGSRIRQKTRG